MMKWSVGKLAVPGIALALIVLAANAWVSYRTTRELAEKEGWVQHTQEVLTRLEGVMTSVNGAVAAERYYLLTGELDELGPYWACRARIADFLDQLTGLTADNPHQQEGIRQLRSGVTQELAALDNGIELRKAGRADADGLGRTLRSGKAAFNTVTVAFDAMKAEEKRLLLERTTASKASLTKALATVAVASGVAMAMVLLAYLLARSDEARRARTARQLQAGEVRKAAILDAVLDCIVGMDADGRVIEWNAAAERTFGHDRDKAVGRDMADLIIPPAYRQRHRDGLRKYLATGEGAVIGRRIEITALRADGSEFPIDLAITPILSDGAPLFTGYVRDITEQKKAADAFRETAEFNRRLIDSSPDCIKILDLQGRLVSMSEGGQKLLEISDLTPLLGCAWPDFWSGSGAGSQPARTAVETARAGGTARFEGDCPTFAGTPKWWDVAVTPIFGADGKPERLLSVSRDITAQKQDQIRLQANEERVRLLLESSGEGVYGVDLNGDCTFANAACARLMGYKTPAELLGKPTHELFHHTRPDGTPYPREACPIYQAFHTGKGVQIDNEVFWRRDGSSFPVEYGANPILRDGRTIGAVVSFVDISRRRQAEQDMRLRESALRSIAQGIFITDPGRTDEPIIFVNAAFERLTGYARQDVKGLEIDYFRAPETDPLELDGLRDALKANRAHTAELLLQQKDGRTFWATVSLSPVAGAGGNFTHFVGVLTDVTDRKAAEEELRRAKEDAEAAKEQAMAANVSKSQFLANMSHELRTPLNAVIMYSELLQEEAVDEGVQRFIPDLDKIRGAGRHLLSLVNGVLDLSKIEAGKMELYLETFEACPMAQEVATTVQPLIDKKSNSLELHCRPDVGSMHADVTKVRQILFNLLSNASKFTEKGVVRLDVERDDVGGAPWVTFRVTDSGIGMTPEQMTRLFQPFTQADASTTRKFGGTGLGLTISKRFCEMMGGEISITSEPGKGSVFTVHLPARVAKPALPEAVKSPGQVLEPTTAGDTIVLVIDDDPAVRDLMARSLGTEAVHTVTAADGEEGLRLARELHPHLIFLDVLMPKIDGWTVLTDLKADPNLADIPVVMLTITNNQEMGFVLGASEYLTKPIDRDRLSAVVAKYRPGEPPSGVLVVDDDEATRQVLRRMLTKQGWTVAEAENGRVAIERIKTSKPRLILTDLMMPEMDGFEFLSELRQNEEWSSIPVVVLTSKDLAPNERAMLTGNVERIVQKGAYTRDALLREVRKIVSLCAPKVPGPQDVAVPGAVIEPEVPTPVIEPPAVEVPGQG